MNATRKATAMQALHQEEINHYHPPLAGWFHCVEAM